MVISDKTWLLCNGIYIGPLRDNLCHATQAIAVAIPVLLLIYCLV